MAAIIVPSQHRADYKRDELNERVQGTRKLPGFRTSKIGPQRKLGPEHNTWYWNPFRVGAGEAPRDFQKKLREVDPDNLIDVRWNPIIEKWGVFYRNPKIAHPICTGWVLLFLVEPRELDERVLARLYSASAQRWGNARQYFSAVEREMEREAAKRDANRRQEAVDLAMPYWEHSQIKVAMRGKSSGDKFSRYHA